jgi:Major Facilitator Superfamily
VLVVNSKTVMKDSFAMGGICGVAFQPKPFGPIAVVGDTGLACMRNEPDTRFRLGARARWSIMIISLGVTASSFLFINGVAFLIPSLEARRGIPLTEAGLLASMPSWGMVVTLVLWGYVLDRVGERTVMTAGSALTAAAAYAAASDGVGRYLSVPRRDGRG